MNRNVFWSATEAASAAFFSATSAFVVARIIGPTELGTAAAAVSLHVILWVGVNALFADAIVRADHVDTIAESSAARASLGVGVAAALIQCSAGLILSRTMQEPRLFGMALALALPLPLVGLAGPRQGMLTRARAYRHLAMRSVAAGACGTVVGVGCGLAGAGAWAPGAQQTVGSSIGALVLLAGWRPRPAWSWTAVRDLLRTGLPLTASTLTQIARYRLFAILIGSFAGPAALGQVHLAFRLVDMIRELTFTALWRLMLPVLSEQQHDQAAMLALVDRLLRRSALVILPLCAAMALCLPWGVRLLLGPAWHSAGSATVPLSLLMILLALTFPSGVALIAAGGVRFTLFANLVGLAATALGVLLLRPDNARTAVLIWCAAQVLVTPYAMWMNGRALGVGPLRPLRAGIGAALGYAAIAAIARVIRP